jgi:hypothetical protein
MPSQTCSSSGRNLFDARGFGFLLHYTTSLNIIHRLIVCLQVDALASKKPNPVPISMKCTEKKQLCGESAMHQLAYPSFSVSTEQQLAQIAPNWQVFMVNRRT